MAIQFKGNKEAATQMSFEPLPEGDYALEVQKIPTLVRTSTNRDMLKFELTVTEGEYINRKLFYNLVFIPEVENGEVQKGHGMTIRALQAFGIQHDGQVEIEPEDFHGANVIAHISNKPDTFKDKDGNPKTVRKNELAWFVANDAAPDSKPATPKAAPKPAGVQRDPDDVPF